MILWRLLFGVVNLWWSCVEDGIAVSAGQQYSFVSLYAHLSPNENFQIASHPPSPLLVVPIVKRPEQHCCPSNWRLCLKPQRRAQLLLSHPAHGVPVCCTEETLFADPWPSATGSCHTGSWTTASWAPIAGRYLQPSVLNWNLLTGLLTCQPCSSQAFAFPSKPSREQGLFYQDNVFRKCQIPTKHHQVPGIFSFRTSVLTRNICQKLGWTEFKPKSRADLLDKASPQQQYSLRDSLSQQPQVTPASFLLYTNVIPSEIQRSFQG